ncbi:hypothetical protein HOK021_60650 [Streptomyces hygroscopicus]|nr:hypothetical protein HOK021_60650 [Streptomyces hygroscopicus]
MVNLRERAASEARHHSSFGKYLAQRGNNAGVREEQESGKELPEPGQGLPERGDGAWPIGRKRANRRGWTWSICCVR